MNITGQRIAIEVSSLGQALEKAFSTLHPNSEKRLAPCTALRSGCAITLVFRSTIDRGFRSIDARDEEVAGLMYISTPRNLRLSSGYYSLMLHPGPRASLRDVNGRDVASSDTFNSTTKPQSSIDIDFKGRCSIDISLTLVLEACCNAESDQAGGFGFSTTNCFTIDLKPFII